MPFVETFRSRVNPSDCDQLGHMNISRYFSACSDGVFALQSEFGMGISDIRAGKTTSFACVRVESDFMSEIASGEEIVLYTGILNIGSKSILFRHRLIRTDHDIVAFETAFHCVLLDLEHRRAIEIPDDVREKAQAYLITADD